MNLVSRFAPFLVLTACIPSLPAGWSGSSTPPPPPPPHAASAFDDEAPGEPPPAEDDAPPQQRETRVRTSESRTESHKINGREIGGGGGGGSSGRASNDKFPQPSQQQMKDLLRALDRMPPADRAKELGTLIDPFYLTVDQLAVLVDEVPKYDRVRAIDVAACSVVDPENAARIEDVVIRGDRAKAIGTLRQQCFRKNNWDRRPPGKMGERAAPPPGAYLLPSER